MENIKKVGKDKYRFVTSVGSGPSRKRPSNTVICTGGKKELQRMYEEFEREAKSNARSDITVGQLLDEYITYCKSIGRKQTTIRGYEIATERFSAPFKRLLAKKCTVAHIEKEIAQMGDKRLKPKTIKNSVGVLSAAFGHAIYAEQLVKNPCEKIKLPEAEHPDIRILHEDEIQPFLYAIADESLDDKVAYELALFMGLRRSEILGLREADVNIMSGVVFVHNTRHRVDGADYDAGTKTQRSTRALALPDILVLDIARLLEQHRQFKYEKVDYLIQDGFGGAILPQTLSSRLIRLEKRAGLPHVTLHGLRHTYASLLHNSGVDMAGISASLGHTNITTTSNIYTHIFKTPSQSSRQIAGVINRFEEKNRTAESDFREGVEQKWSNTENKKP